MKLIHIISAVALSLSGQTLAYDADSTDSFFQYFEYAFNANEAYQTTPQSQIYTTATPPSINTAAEGLRVIEFVEYESSNTGAPAGYTRINLANVENGLNAAVFYNNQEAILAFRGSELGLKDWITNGEQAKGKAPTQYKDAVKIAKQFKRAFPNHKLLMTGHSLGGGLATTATLFTGIESITYNSAGVADVVLNWVKRKLRQNGLPANLWKTHANRVLNFNFEGDFVSDTDGQQDADALGISTFQYGRIHYLSDDRFNPLDRETWDTPLRRHYTVVLKEELKFLSQPMYRQFSDRNMLGNPFVADATKTFETICFTSNDFATRDCTEDGFDVFLWEIDYFLDSIPSIVADLFIPME
ncbi:MAG: DUF2974 domain-containing protein [Gammaproteobacteria bacterium]|nr:DUF2974 domain-containing protein [Gammaproteobacteria bacterium]